MIMVLGNGYISRAITSEMAQRGIEHKTIARSQYDYTNFDILRKLIRRESPELVINCAVFIKDGYADRCEDDKESTLLGNLVLPITVSHACEVWNVPLMHISTGCLYNGDNGGRGFTEDDPPHLTFNTACGFYVGSKQLAEQALTGYPGAYICRIRLPFDEFDHPRNFLTKIRTYPKVFSATNSIAHRGDFAKACLDLWAKRAPLGIYNMTNPGAISAREITEMMQKFIPLGREFEFWDEAEFLNKVARTTKSNCILNTEKLAGVGVKIRNVEEAVIHSLMNWKPL